MILCRFQRSASKPAATRTIAAAHAAMKDVKKQK